MVSRFVLGILSVSLLGGDRVAPTVQDKPPRFEWVTCDFPLPAAVPQDVKRECAYLVVPESRARPDGRMFKLAVVVYRAREPGGVPPLLLLHGGPGGIGGTR